MKPTTKQKKEVERYIKKWKPRLNLHEWDIKITYKEGVDDTFAQTTVQSDYLRAEIEIFREHWNRSIEEREKTIVHELSHCIADEMFNSFWNLLANGKHVTKSNLYDILERLVQRIRNISMKDR